MLFSVLVPVYNAEAVLNRCVDSILKQTLGDFELLLLNDGSTDGTARLCEKWAERDARVRVICQSNQGVAAARNRLLQEARGEYFVPVDADDWVDENYLQTLYCLCTHWNVRLAACNHWIVGEEKQRTCFNPNTQPRLLSACEACHGILYHKEPDVCVWAKIYHRSLMEGLRYPEGKLYEDTSLFAQVVIRAREIAYTPQPLYHYWQGRDSICRTGYNPSRMDYLFAVDRLTEEILRNFPQEKKGCVRRKCHAALSVRRYFVDAPPQAAEQKKQLDRLIAAQRLALFCDKEAPMRDKVASFLLMLGDVAFDAAWKGYAKWRKIR